MAPKKKKQGQDPISSESNPIPIAVRPRRSNAGRNSRFGEYDSGVGSSSGRADNDQQTPRDEGMNGTNANNLPSNKKKIKSQRYKKIKLEIDEQLEDDVPEIPVSLVDYEPLFEPGLDGDGDCDDDENGVHFDEPIELDLSQLEMFPVPSSLELELESSPKRKRRGRKKKVIEEDEDQTEDDDYVPEVELVKSHSARSKKVNKRKIPSDSVNDDSNPKRVVTDFSEIDEPLPITEKDLPSDMAAEEKTRLIKTRKQQISNYRESMKNKILSYYTGMFRGPLDHSDGETIIPTDSCILLSDGKTRVCPLCDNKKTFTTRQGFQYHYKRCVQQNNSWTCLICKPEVPFPTRSYLFYHLESAHRDQLPELPEKLNKYRQKKHPNSTASAAKSPATSAKSPAPKRIIRHKDDRSEMMHSCVNLTDLLMELVDGHSYRPFNSVNFNCNISDWNPFQNYDDLASYLPKRAKSIKFRIGSLSYSPQHEKDIYHEHNDWLEMIPFSSILGMEQCITFFAGDAITAAAWLPYPINETVQHFQAGNSDQLYPHEYLAIATQSDPTATFKYCDNSEQELSSKGIIQLWECSNLEEKFSRKGSVRLSLVIGHEWGRISDLKWAPFGLSYESSVTNVKIESDTIPPLKRLGLLALACLDSNIRILSVPYPNLYGKHVGTDPTTQQPHYLKPNPCLVLVPPERRTTPVAGRCGAALCIDWSVTETESILIAGYGSGLICVWDLLSESQILTLTSSQNMEFPSLSPILTWEAHAAAVTCLALAPSHLKKYNYANADCNGLILATGSLDRAMHVWNICNGADILWSVSLPQEITTIAWSPSVEGGIVVGTDDTLQEFNCFNHVKCELFDPAVKDTQRSSRPTLMFHSSPVNSIAMNYYFGTFVSVDSSGEVLMFIHDTKVRSRESRKTKFDRVPLFRIDAQQLSDADKAKARETHREPDNDDDDENEDHVVTGRNDRNESSDSMDDIVSKFMESNIKWASKVEENEEIIQSLANSQTLNVDGDHDTATQVINLTDCIPADDTSGQDQELELSGIQITTSKHQVKKKVSKTQMMNHTRKLKDPPTKAAIPADIPPLDSYEKWTKQGWGIKFLDNRLTQPNTYPRKEFERALKDEDTSKGSNKFGVNYYRPLDYPAISAQLALWNPNVHARTWLLVTTGSGLCRLVCVQMLTQI